MNKYFLFSVNKNDNSDLSDIFGANEDAGQNTSSVTGTFYTFILGVALHNFTNKCGGLQTHFVTITVCFLFQRKQKSAWVSI